RRYSQFQHCRGLRSNAAAVLRNKARTEKGMKKNPKAEVRSCRRRRKETLFDSAPTAFNQSLLTSSPTRFILRFGCWLVLGFRIRDSKPPPRPQLNVAPSDTFPPLPPPRPEILPSFCEQPQLAIVLAIIVFVAAVCAVVWFLLRPKPPV